MTTVPTMRISLLLVLAAVVLVGGACSDDSDKVIAKDDLIAQGDELCRASNQRLEETASAIAPNDIDALRAALDDDLIPELRARVDGLRDLGYPGGGDKEVLQGIYDDYDAAIDDVADNPADYIESGQDPFEDVAGRLSDYGFVACGTPQAPDGG